MLAPLASWQKKCSLYRPLVLLRRRASGDVASHRRAQKRSGLGPPPTLQVLRGGSCSSSHRDDEPSSPGSLDVRAMNRHYKISIQNIRNRISLILFRMF